MSNAQTDAHDKIFLATTALEEFWDTTKPIIFLGRGCLLYNRRSFWEPLNGSLMESPFDNNVALQAANHYVSEIYERLLHILGSALNTTHETYHSPRYWRILLGPWLMHYLPAVYDRYIHLKQALAQYPNCTTLVLSENSFVVPSDTSDFMNYISKDLYNLQIYTKLLAALGKTFPCKTAPIEQNLLCVKVGKRPLKRKIRDCIVKIYQGVSAKLSPLIVLNQSYFPRSIEIRFLIKTTCNILPMFPFLTKQATFSHDGAIRKNLPKIEIGHSEFEQCLSAMLFTDIPKCFMENFCHVRNDAQNNYPKTPLVIFSATTWYYGEEAFKHWAATSAENGTLLVGTAHGGAYGGWANFPAENHETAITDVYYTWGWERIDCVAKVIPMPATKLVGQKKMGASNRKHGILWVATTCTRYLFRICGGLFSAPKYFQSYLSWHSRFAKILSPQVIANLRVRPHIEDYGWCMAQRLKECIPGVTIETWDVSFQASLANCRLYVCDHMSTTYTEALSANKPTILFWNPHANELRPEAQPYYDLLRKNGILFDTPESAGAAINQIYEDVETWWNNPERQNAVETFCKRFARTSPEAIDLWAAEFERLVAIAK